MPRVKRKGDAYAKAATPQLFTIMRDAYGRGWRVKHGQRWIRAREISLLTSALLRPIGEIVGEGVVTRKGPDIVITG
jgi:hypothetical protein